MPSEDIEKDSRGSRVCSQQRLLTGNKSPPCLRCYGWAECCSAEKYLQTAAGQSPLGSTASFAVSFLRSDSAFLSSVLSRSPSVCLSLPLCLPSCQVHVSRKPQHGIRTAGFFCSFFFFLILSFFGLFFPGLTCNQSWFLPWKLSVFDCQSPKWKQAAWNKSVTVNANCITEVHLNHTRLSLLFVINLQVPKLSSIRAYLSYCLSIWLVRNVSPHCARNLQGTFLSMNLLNRNRVSLRNVA